MDPHSLFSVSILPRIMSSSLTAGNTLYPRMIRTSPDMTAPLGSTLIYSSGFWTPSLVYFLYTEHARLIPVLGSLYKSFQEPRIIFLFVPILLMWHLLFLKGPTLYAMLNSIIWFYSTSGIYYYVKIIQVFVSLPLPVSPSLKWKLIKGHQAVFSNLSMPLSYWVFLTLSITAGLR